MEKTYCQHLIAVQCQPNQLWCKRHQAPFDKETCEYCKIKHMDDGCMCGGNPYARVLPSLPIIVEAE